MKKRSYISQIFASAILFSAAAGLFSSPAKALTQDEVSNLSGPEREKILIEGARKEGKMLWYTSMIVDQAVRPMVAGF